MDSELTFHENFAVRTLNTPGAWTAGAQYGTWVDMTGFRRCAIIPVAGELDANMAVAAYCASDNAGTDAAVIDADTDGTFHNGADEGLPAIIEFSADDLTAGQPYITLAVTAGATDGFCAVAILYDAYSAPVDNTEGTDVAFIGSTI